jgi:hypothetical protein
MKMNKNGNELMKNKMIITSPHDVYVYERNAKVRECTVPRAVKTVANHG